MHQMHDHIAVQQRASLFGEAGEERRRERTRRRRSPRRPARDRRRRSEIRTGARALRAGQTEAREAMLLMRRAHPPRCGHPSAGRCGRSGWPGSLHASPGTASVRERSCSANSRSAIVGAGLAVEIAGRLVGEQHCGSRRDGARERDALLLAAGELSRIVIDARAKTDGFEFGPARDRRHRARRQARAARRHSPARSSSG